MSKAKTIEQFLAAPNRYTELSVSSQKIDDMDLIKLSAVLKGNSTLLTQLDFNHDEIGVIGVVAIGESLKSNTTLMSLSLNHNGIGDVGVVSLAEGLNSNTILTRLDLNHNKIGFIGAVSLAESLKNNTALTGLSLGSNQIGEVGAKAIGKSLKGNTTLTRLDLNHNEIGDVGVINLSEALKDNITLSEFYLNGNQIGDIGMAVLEQLELQRLNIDGQKSITEQETVGVEQEKAVTAYSIEQFLASPNDYTELFMCDKKISDLDSTELGEILKESTTLTRAYSPK